MPDPYRELVSMFEKRISDKTVRAVSGVPCELGTMTSTGLKLDGFKYEVRDFLVADYLTLPEDFFTTTEPDSGAHAQYTGDGRHDHKIVTPEQLKPLKPGDRVLVVPVNGGNDFVVIARVMPNG